MPKTFFSQNPRSPNLLQPNKDPTNLRTKNFWRISEKIGNISKKQFFTPPHIQVHSDPSPARSEKKLHFGRGASSRRDRCGRRCAATLLAAALRHRPAPGTCGTNGVGIVASCSSSAHVFAAPDAATSSSLTPSEVLVMDAWMRVYMISSQG